MNDRSAQKRNDVRFLRHEHEVISREEVLRTVLAIVLDAETAAWCAGWRSSEEPLARWPSTLYRLLARAALTSASVWCRCSIVLDRALASPMRAYANRSPNELVELFLEGRDSLSGEELAALLWCLMRRKSGSHDLLAQRLGLELEVVAARRLAVAS